MSIEATIKRCAELGVRLSLADDGRLRVVAEQGVIDDVLRGQLTAHRDAITAQLRSCSPVAAPESVPRGTPHPLSNAQRRLWILDRIEPGSSRYSIPSAMRLPDDIDADTLLKAIHAIVRRHESLRTTFSQTDGVPCQIIHDAVRVDARTIDFSALSATREHTDALISAALREETAIGFDLQHGPLLRVRLYLGAASGRVLYLAMHHIVGDGWSNGLFLAELQQHYAAICNGAQCAELPALPLQYVDYAHWQQRALSRERQDLLLGYWRQRLANWQALELPLDRPRPPRPTATGGLLRERIAPATVSALRELARVHRTTLFSVLLATFYVLLRKYSGQDDIVIGSDVANRTRREWETLIGFFVNQLVLRADLSGNPGFIDFLARVHSMTLDAYSNQELPFDALVEHLLQGRDHGLSPFFQVKFIMQNTPSSAEGDSLQQVIELPHRYAKFDMTWSVAEDAAGMSVDIEYASELYDEQTIRRLSTHYGQLLNAVIADPGQKIDRLRIDTARADALIARTRRALECPHTADTLGRVIEHWAAQTPEAIAAIDGAATLSYRQLNEESNKLARHLIEWGIEAESPVGVCMPSSIDYAIAVAAVSKAGGVLVAIDPAYPEQRIAHILDASGLQVLLCASPVLDRLPAYQLNFLGVIVTDRDGANWATQAVDDLNLPVHPDQLAYLIFTSGTTGKPKGVMVGASGLHNLASAQRRHFGLASGHRVLQFASIGFDASVWELLMAFGHGATLVCAARETIMPGPDLAHAIISNRISHITLPPSALAVLPEAVASQLEVLILAGEACRDEMVRGWGSQTNVFNAYGPSETTVCASIDRYDSALQGFAGSIGYPIDGCGLYVVGADGELAAAGIAGELWIAGPALGRGYWNDPAQTALRFVPDPFSAQPGARAYRSGDRARFRLDDRVEFLGRLDLQVKIRGHRIELGEIERELLAQPHVRAAVVTALGEPAQLHAYVVCAVGNALDEVALKKSLRQSLPEYMIPRTINAIERIPATSNGKLDLAALPPPQASRDVSPQEQPASPEETAIAALWCDVLGLERVGVRENFFDVGGHSLLLIQVQERIRAQLGAEISVAELFKYPTVQGLASFLGDGEHGDKLRQSDARIARRQQAGRERTQRRHSQTLGEPS